MFLLLLISFNSLIIFPFFQEEKKQRDEIELRHIPIKYSRRAKLYYVRLYGFKLVSGEVIAIPATDCKTKHLRSSQQCILNYSYLYRFDRIS